MADAATLALIFSLRDEVSAGLDNINKQLGGLNNNPVATGLLAGGFATLTSAALDAGAAVIGGIGDSIGVAADFASQMQRVGAVSGASASEIQMMRDAAIEMGSATVFSSSEAAAAMFELAAGGMNAEQSVAALPGTLALAAAGGVELASAAEITAATLNGFQFSADQAGAVADKFSVIANISAAGVLDLGESMKYVAPVAAAMGMSIDDTGAALAVLANNGIKGSQSGTALRAIMLGLSAPSAEAAKMIESLGIEVFNAQGQMKSMPEVIAEFVNGTANLTEQQRAAAIATIVGREASGSMLALMAAGETTLADYSNQLANSAGAAEKMATESQTAFDLMKGNIGGSIEQIQIALGDVFIPLLVLIGNSLAGLTPYVLQFIANLQTILPAGQAIADFFAANWQPALIAVAAILGGLLVAAIGAAAAALGGIIVAAAPVIAIIAALMAVGYAIYNAWQSNFLGIQQVTASALAAVQAVIMSVVGVIMAFWTQNGATIMAQTQQIWAQIQSIIGGVLYVVMALVSAIFGGIAQFISANQTQIVAFFSSAWQLIQGVIGAALTLINGIVQTAVALLQGDWDGMGKAVLEMSANLVANLGDVFLGLWGMIEPGIKAAWDQFVSSATQLGGDVVGGILKGIGDNAGKLFDKLKQLASDAVKAAKSALGIKSPSTVFANVIGGNIVAGLVSGIEAGIGDVQSAAGALAGATTLPFATAGTAAPLAAGTSNTTNEVNLTINVNGNADRSTIAQIETAARKAVQDALDAAGQRARARTVTA